VSDENEDDELTPWKRGRSHLCLRRSGIYPYVMRWKLRSVL